MDQKRFLRLLNGDPMLYPWTEALASRGDMVECDDKGKPVAQPIKLPTPPAYAPRQYTPPANPDEKPVPVGISDNPENVPPAAPPPAGPSSGRVADEEAPLPPEEAAKQAQRKQDLIKFAKDRFNITIDPEESLAVIEKKIAKKLKTPVPENLEG